MHAIIRIEIHIKINATYLIIHEIGQLILKSYEKLRSYEPFERLRLVVILSGK